MTDPPKQLCSARTDSGEACRAWAMRGSEELHGRPLCRAHAEQTPAAGELVPAGSWAGAHGRSRLYGIYFEEDEIAALEEIAATGADGDSLTAEVELVRVLLRRLLAELDASGELASLSPILLAGARTVADLLRSKQALGSGEGRFPPGIDGALDILSEEWGVDL